MLFLRALLAFLLLPTVVAGIVPAWLARGAVPMRGIWLAGGAALAIGVVILGWCVRDFYVAGRGTLAPWDPPRRLVVVGLYRWTRNPMYVGVLMLLAGWALCFPSRRLAGYALCVALAVHLRVVFFEEPALRRRFGQEWEIYAARTNRWWLRRPAPRKSGGPI
jgi:protein-S-isoprenylcysteine O-methyltransferase Ste14